MLLTVQNMTCNHCTHAVTSALTRLDPNANVSVVLARGEVQVQGSFGVAEAIAALTAAGYPAQEQLSPAACTSPSCCDH